jgi:ABC-type glycerol-3-phosphate transport system substrate-binding protein
MAFVFEICIYNDNSQDTTDYYYYLSKDGDLTEIPIEIPGVEKTSHYEWTDDDDESEMDISEVSAEDGEQDDDIVISEGSDDDDDSYDYNGIDVFKLVDADNLYVLDYNGTVYHVSISSGTIVNTIEDFDYAYGITVCGSSVIINSWDKIAQYDISTDKKMAEFDTLLDTTQSLTGSVVYADNYTDNGLLYFACNDGIYAYNIADDTTEQIVDGNMSSLFMTDSSIEYLTAKTDGDFILSYTDYSSNNSTRTLLNYSYDAEASKYPDKSLTVYSLNENYTVRQVAAMYQKSHPDTYVHVEYGVSDDDAITASDAIRTLNTEIMAGEGPDIIFLDGMPIDSYVDKGLLEDVSDIVDGLIDDGQLFETVAKTYESSDGQICAVPTNFTVPVIIAKSDVLENINSLSDIAAAAEAYAAEDHKDSQSFMQTYSALSIMGTMMSSNSAAWFNDDGTLDEESLKSYLTDVKTIYDAIYNSLSESDQADLDEMASWYNNNSGELDISWFGSDDPSWESLYIMAGTSQIAVGNMSSADGLEYITSANRQNADIGYKLLPGAAGNVYTPSNIIGINSKSKDMDSAKAFLSYLLSADGQTVIADYNSGFAVSTEAFNQIFVNPYLDEDWYDPGDSLGGIGTSDENGNEINLELYWPEEEDIEEFKSMINQLETASYNDNTILNTILNDCIGCILGDDDIDAAVEQVTTDINIYLAE